MENMRHCGDQSLLVDKSSTSAPPEKGASNERFEIIDSIKERNRKPDRERKRKIRDQMTDEQKVEKSKKHHEEYELKKMTQSPGIFCFIVSLKSYL